MKRKVKKSNRKEYTKDQSLTCPNCLAPKADCVCDAEPLARWEEENQETSAPSQRHSPWSIR